MNENINVPEENTNTPIREEENVSSAPPKKKKTIVLILGIVALVICVAVASIFIYRAVCEYGDRKEERIVENMSYNKEFYDDVSLYIYCKFPDTKTMVLTVPLQRFDKRSWNKDCIADILNSYEVKNDEYDFDSMYITSYTACIARINKRLDLSDAVTERMWKTKASDGVKKKQTSKTTVSWQFIDDVGLEITYKNE